VTRTLDETKVPDSPLGLAIAEFVREAHSPLLFHHSSRVYHFAALAGERRALKFDRELLYAGAMFHDIGLLETYSNVNNRFEVDSAEAAAEFLRSYGIAPSEITLVWTAIALHTTPGIPRHMDPLISLVTAGVEMDVLGIGFSDYSETQRRQVISRHPEATGSRKTSSTHSIPG
jgi:putative nucleotidyltransferase with HDIG domain